MNSPPQANLGTKSIFFKNIFIVPRDDFKEIKTNGGWSYIKSTVKHD